MALVTLAFGQLVPTASAYLDSRDICSVNYPYYVRVRPLLRSILLASPLATVSRHFAVLRDHLSPGSSQGMARRDLPTKWGSVRSAWKSRAGRGKNGCTSFSMTSEVLPTT